MKVAELILAMLIGGLVGMFVGAAIVDRRQNTDPGMACYVNIHPSSNERDTVWTCFRLRRTVLE